MSTANRASHVPPAIAAATGLSPSTVSASPGSPPSPLAPSGPVDFRVFSSGMATYGSIDSKGVVTKAEDGQYPYLNDLMRLIGKDDLMGELAQLPRPVVQMTGSSTEQDLDGDIMYASAVADMTQVDDRLSICLNHSYNLPEDLYGSLVEQPWTRSQGGITDLYLRSDVAVLNPRAVTTYLYTAQGRRIGVSGGFCVLEAEWIDRKTGKPLKDQDVDFFDVMEGAVSLGIKHVKAVEWSTVTIPSNQRSWVEGAIKGYFARTFDPKIAPIVRASLTQADYNKIIVQATDPALRKQLEDIMPRKVASATPRRIYWNPMDGVFTLGTGQALERKEVGALLKHAGEHVINLVHVDYTETDVEASVEVVEDDTTTMDTTDIEDVTTKAATDEEKAAQEARSKKYGIGIKEGGSVTKPSKYKDIPDDQWADPTNYRYHMEDKAHADNAAARWGDASNRGQYTPKEQDIISQRIEKRQRSFGETPEDKSASVPSEKAGEPSTSKVSTHDMLTKAGGVSVAADGSHEPMTGTHTHAHKAFGSQGDDGMHEHAHAHKADADHHHPHPDGMKAVDGASLTIGEDGSHGAFTGTHTHGHKAFGSQGNDGMHEHEHEHKSDGDHHHSHAGLKAGEDAIDKTAAGGQSGEPAGTPDHPKVPIADNGEHAPMTGRHSHKHAAYGMADGDGSGYHEHEHEHNSDGDHGHDHMSTAFGPNAKSAKDTNTVLDLSTPDPERDLFLSTYRHIAGKYGLPSITADGRVDMTKCNLVGSDEDAQRVISLVSEADLYADALDSTIDRLMKTLGVRDVDNDGDGDDGVMGDYTDGDAEIPGGEELLPNPSYPMYRQQSLKQSLNATTRMMIKLLGIANLTKAGARHSAADVASIQTIHDAAAKLTDGAVCKSYADSTTQNQGDNTPAEGGSGTSEQDARNQEAGKGTNMGANTHTTRGFDPEMLKAIPDLVTSSQSILDLLGKLNLKDYEDAVQDARLKLASVNKAVSGYEARQKALESQAQAIGEQFTTLTNLPLPRPTQLNRSLDMNDPLTREATATYGDMQKVNGANTANKAAVQQGAVPSDGGPLTLKQALALTEVVEVDGITYRHWPQSVTPLGGRPALTNEQKQFTRTAVEWAYIHDEEAYIPLRGESVPTGE